MKPLEKGLYRSRLAGKADKVAGKFMSSLEEDWEILLEDIVGTEAHDIMLCEQGIIPRSDLKKILGVLEKLREEAEKGTLKVEGDYEDIHEFLEDRVIREIGVEAGGRTGLTSLVVALLFLLALFFSPIVAMIGSYAQITAPALVLVGAMMMRNVSRIEWNDYSESIPAFLALIGIPLSYSISDGLALGFISYPLIKLFSGRQKEVSWLSYVLAIILIFYFVFLKTKSG